ncbi:MAG: hypothetical protein JWQ43_2395 [Glaciihabitans sp.]|nr:hypothetical protein [Glaciihabitans sp.]
MRLLAKTRFQWGMNAAIAMAAAIGCFYLAGSRQHPVVIIVGLAFLAMSLQFAQFARQRAKG